MTAALLQLPGKTRHTSVTTVLMRFQNNLLYLHPGVAGKAQARRLELPLHQLAVLFHHHQASRRPQTLGGAALAVYLDRRTEQHKNTFFSTMLTAACGTQQPHTASPCCPGAPRPGRGSWHCHACQTQAAQESVCFLSAPRVRE